MDPDDSIRSALQRYTSGPVAPPDIAEIQRRGHQRVVRQRWERGLAAAVTVGILVGVAALVVRVWADPSLDDPIGPSPSSSVSITPSPSTTPSPTVSATPTLSPSPSESGLSFGVNPAAGVNPGPVGGVGDTIEGLRLDAVEITAVTCPNGEQCPGTFALTVTNTTGERGTWEVLAYTYYGSSSTLGNSSSVTIGAGDSAVVTITLDSSQDANQGLNKRYTWNWSALPPT